MFVEKNKEIGLNFEPWVLYDEKHMCWHGIRDDAPEWAKKDYAEWVKEKSEREAEERRINGFISK